MLPAAARTEDLSLTFVIRLRKSAGRDIHQLLFGARRSNTRERMKMDNDSKPILIQGGRVWDPDGNTDLPKEQTIVVQNGRIDLVGDSDAASDVERALVGQATRGQAEVIDARGKLIMPGFVNGHYHSYDTLVKGLVEDAPFDVWALHSQPAYYGKRSPSELRLRTILGAIDCLKNGITTVQDMCTLIPQDEETLDIIASAYHEVGIRTVFCIPLRDIADLDIEPFLPASMPAEVRAIVQGTPRNPYEDILFVERQLSRLRQPRWHWALSASGPQRSSQALLEGLVDLSSRHQLPLLTHAYETKAQTAKARHRYAASEGSMVRHLANIGFLTPRTTLAHGVWLAQNEIELLAQHGSGVVLNPMSNMKLKSGVAPIRRLHAAGVNLALGCDNCSCGDCQSIFQAMKLHCLLAAVSDPNPTGVHACNAIDAATLGGARAVGLNGEVGRIREGFRADLTIIDLSDVAYMPLNSVGRQLVYSETGRGVETVIVEGRIVMRDRELLTVDEAQFRAELENIMPVFRKDFESLRSSNSPAIPFLLRANRLVVRQDVGDDRFLASEQKWADAER